MRIVRKTDDGLSMASLIASLAFLGLSVVVGLTADDRVVQLCAWGFTLIVLAGSLVLVVRFVFPRVLEFTIDSTQIRFGTLHDPPSCCFIARVSVRSIVFDPEDGSLCIDTGAGTAFPLAPDILIHASQMQNVAAFIREHWPEIPVFSQREYQEKCQTQSL